MNDKEIAEAVAVAVGVIPNSVATVEQCDAIAKLLTQFLTDFSDLSCSLGCMSSIAIDHHEACLASDDDENLGAAEPKGSC